MDNKEKVVKLMTYLGLNVAYWGTMQYERDTDTLFQFKSFFTIQDRKQACVEQTDAVFQPFVEMLYKLALDKFLEEKLWETVNLTVAPDPKG